MKRPWFLTGLVILSRSQTRARRVGLGRPKGRAMRVCLGCPKGRAMRVCLGPSQRDRATASMPRPVAARPSDSEYALAGCAQLESPAPQITLNSRTTTHNSQDITAYAMGGIPAGGWGLCRYRDCRGSSQRKGNYQLRPSDSFPRTNRI